MVTNRSFKGHQDIVLVLCGAKEDGVGHFGVHTSFYT